MSWWIDSTISKGGLFKMWKLVETCGNLTFKRGQVWPIYRALNSYLLECNELAIDHHIVGFVELVGG